MKYTIVSDDDGHRYVIPVDKKSEWDKFMSSEDYDNGEIPEYADHIPGCLSLLKFDSYIIK